MDSKYRKIFDEIIDEKNASTPEVYSKNTGKRNYRIAGIIADALRKRVGAEIIVTGGLSVELWSDGQYATEDIDVATVAEKELEEILEELGFEKQAKYWVQEDLDVLLEIVANVPFGGEIKEPVSIETEDGYSVLFVDVNDMIIDRIRGLVHWKFEEYGKWIREMIIRQKDLIDIDYIKEQLEGEELDEFMRMLSIVNDPSSSQALLEHIKETLTNAGVVHSTYREDELEYVILSLSGKAKEELGQYFGILIEPVITFLYYDEDEEEFNPVNEDRVSLIKKIADKYGQPFTLIEEILEEGL